MVRHKIFDYRAVVVGWDPKPRMDVTGWDGLVHIENPSELPFYQVVVDRDGAFGKFIPTRYVCQENLELCSDPWQSMSVDLPNDWTKLPNGRYVPPTEDAVRKCFHSNFNGVVPDSIFICRVALV